MTLSSLSSRLREQFVNVNLPTVPETCLTEAVRHALSELNTTLSENYQLANLDGALATTLPDTHIPVLLLGASAFILEFSARSWLVSFNTSAIPTDPLCAFARSARQDFAQALNRLRLTALQQSANPPAFQIPDPSTAYDPTLDD